MRPVVVVGDALLDRDVSGRAERLCPTAPAPVLDEEGTCARPGGAALAAALLAAGGQETVLVTALAEDPAGHELAELLRRASVHVVNVGLGGATPEKVRLRSGGQVLLRLDRGGPPAPVGPPVPEVEHALEHAAGVLVADYGRGMSGGTALRRCLATVAHRCPLVWDPHPRGTAPVAGARLVTPNRSEAALRAPMGNAGGAAPRDDLAAVTGAARALLRRWQAHAVAVTLGASGALLVESPAGPPLVVPVPRAHGGDPCGAGDRFAASATALLARGALPSEAVTRASAEAAAFVAAGGAAAFVAAGDGGRPDGTGPLRANALEVAARVHAAGGTVVATGGCFDLLHAGHVSLLESARALGDCLVVCLNSDRSVRRLKGPDRPAVAAADRARVLMALESVDAVAVFDEDTPATVLSTLRPELFVKGGDYAGAALAEEGVTAAWGGQVVLVPYLDGRSTSSLLARPPLPG